MRADLLTALLMVLVAAPVTTRADEPDDGPTDAPDEAPADDLPSRVPAKGPSLLDVWTAEHQWFRLGLKAHMTAPSVDAQQALKIGPDLTFDLTTDFFLGIGMKVGFLGGYHNGTGCVRRNAEAGGPACPDSVGQKGGVNYEWWEPIDSNGDVNGEAGDVTPGNQRQVRRVDTHVGYFALTVGANYELTIPTVKVLRVLQPYVGGGLVLMWVYTWSDLGLTEYFLINNDENDVLDGDNVDPFSNQGPEVGGEVYGGLHINVSKAFRFSLEVGYHNVAIGSEPLNKATSGFDARHLDYRIADLRVGGGVGFRF
jgi:hypothetical protein